MQKAINFIDVAIVSIKGSNYRNHFCDISKNDSINIMKDSNLNEKVDHYNFLILYEN